MKKRVIDYIWTSKEAVEKSNLVGLFAIPSEDAVGEHGGDRYTTYMKILICIDMNIDMNITT